MKNNKISSFIKLAGFVFKKNIHNMEEHNIHGDYD